MSGSGKKANYLGRGWVIINSYIYIYVYIGHAEGKKLPNPQRNSYKLILIEKNKSETEMTTDWMTE